MVRNSNMKITCFLCRYEITKHNKSDKKVTYNGKLKTICKFCTKNKHKILENQYKSTDIQCKNCKKPSLYKKCIECSICNHLYHGKCLDLNKNDIEKIENICGFFMCTKCQYEILPTQILYTDQLNSKPASKADPNIKQCLTCHNIVPKSIYPNKHIVYDNKRYVLCTTCSKLGTNIPVKDTSLIEFQDCKLCRKQVRYESIYCDLCQHLVHPYCNGINKKELNRLGNIPDKWYCIDCNLKIYPNQLLVKRSKSKFEIDKSKILKEFITYDDCSVCSKKVTGHMTLSCSTCSHWIHKQCIGKFKNRTEFQNFLHYYSTKPWDCPTCTSEMLPFTFLDNDEFIMLLLDMYTKPLFLNKNNINNVYTRLNHKDFFNITDDENTRQDKYLNNIDPDLNYIPNDICVYTTDTDEIVTKSPNELTMMTFNIRSIKKTLTTLFTYYAV